MRRRRAGKKERIKREITNGKKLWERGWRDGGGSRAQKRRSLNGGKKKGVGSTRRDTAEISLFLHSSR